MPHPEALSEPERQTAPPTIDDTRAARRIDLRAFSPAAIRHRRRMRRSAWGRR